MNIRETDVAWNPAVVRIEYLDEAGAPYYCAFHPRARPPGPSEPDLVRRREIPLGSGWDDVLTEALVGAFLGALAGVLLRTKGGPSAAPLGRPGGAGERPHASGAAPPVQGGMHPGKFLNPGQEGRK